MQLLSFFCSFPGPAQSSKTHRSKMWSEKQVVFRSYPLSSQRQPFQTLWLGIHGKGAGISDSLASEHSGLLHLSLSPRTCTLFLCFPKCGARLQHHVPQPITSPTYPFLSSYNQQNLSGSGERIAKRLACCATSRPGAVALIPENKDGCYKFLCIHRWQLDIGVEVQKLLHGCLERAGQWNRS